MSERQIEENSGKSLDEAMTRYADGDDESFAVLYDGLAPRLLRYLQRHTLNSAQAKDHLQQTLLHMHRARGSFRRGAAVVPWAFAIARRLVLDGARRGKLEPTLSPDARPVEEELHYSADSELEAKQLAGRMIHTLAQLPENQRVAFELIRQDGLSLTEAAAALGTTVTAVKLRLHRASVALRATAGSLPDGESE